MSADKPEAGRTRGCGAVLGRGVERRERADGICGDGWVLCPRCKSLNPAPRPVEATCGNCDVGFPLDGDYHYGTQRLGMIPLTPCAKVANPKPCPVERCSCPDATRYKAALEAIIKCAHVNAPRETIKSIARRALALGGETK